MLRTTLGVGLALVVWGGTGCSAANAPDTPALRRVGSAIVKGIDSTAALDFAVLVNGGCTGTLVAKNLVLTATHCLREEPGAVEDIHVGLDAARRFNEAPPAALSKTVLKAEVDDITLVVLDRDVEAPIARLRLDASANQGEAFVSVGYGINEKDETPPLRQERLVSVLQIPADGRTFIVGEGACEGDSGGPGVAASTKAVVGVAFQAEYDPAPTPGQECLGARIHYVALSAHRDLIDRAFKAAGATPLFEANVPQPSSDAPKSAPTEETETKDVAQPTPPPPPAASDDGCSMTSRRRGASSSTAELGIALLGMLWLRRRRRSV